jgi:hypothetical protein
MSIQFGLITTPFGLSLSKASRSLRQAQAERMDVKSNETAPETNEMDVRPIRIYRGLVV